MAVRVAELIGGAVPEFVLDPADAGAGVLQRLDAPL